MRAALKGQAAWRNPYTEAKVNAPSNAKTNQRLPSYHPDDRRDYDGPAGDDSERTLVSQLTRRPTLPARNHVYHHFDLVNLLRTRKSERQ